MSETRPKSVKILDAYDDTITVNTDPDGMMVCVSIMEHDSTKPVITEVVLPPDKALRLAHAVREAQMFCERAY